MKNTWKKVTAGLLAVALVAGGLPVNIEMEGVFQNAKIVANAQEYADDYVAIKELQKDDILSISMRGLEGEYSVTLKAGGYSEPGDYVPSEDCTLSQSSVYSMHDGAFDGRYSPYCNGNTADAWQVVSVNHEDKKLVLTGYSVPETAPVTMSGDAVPYYAYNAAAENLQCTEIEATKCYQVTEGDRTWENESWYVVTENVTFEKRIIIDGAVHLILTDGVTLTAKQGIQVNTGSKLDILAQSDGDHAGKLFAGTTNGTDTTMIRSPENAAIGGSDYSSNGEINIHGGIINAIANTGAAAIGGGNSSSCGTVNIYGGDVSASLGNANYSASIGGGYYAKGGTVNVLGGTVTAYNQNQNSVPQWNVAKNAVIKAGSNASEAAEVESVGNQYYLHIEAGSLIDNSMTYVEAVPPTCTKSGTVEYWVDADGNKYADAKGQTELSDMIVPATGHQWENPTYTWSADGDFCTASATCANCDEVLKESAVMTYEVKEEATGEKMGTTRYIADFEDSTFAQQINEVQDIPKLLTYPEPESIVREGNAVMVAAPAGSNSVSLQMNAVSPIFAADTSSFSISCGEIGSCVTFNSGAIHSMENAIEGGKGGTLNLSLTSHSINFTGGSISNCNAPKLQAFSINVNQSSTLNIIRSSIQINSESDMIQLVDFSLSMDDKPVNFGKDGGSVEVSVPIGLSNFKSPSVCFLSDSGNLEKMNLSLSGSQNVVIFNTNHNSLYLVLEEAVADEIIKSQSSLADGTYKQTAEKDGTYYTRFVFVKPKSEIEGKSKAKFTATYNGTDYTFETNTYYTGVTTNGVTYTPDSEDSVMFVVTVSSGSDISAALTCTLDFE